MMIDQLPYGFIEANLMLETLSIDRADELDLADLLGELAKLTPDAQERVFRCYNALMLKLHTEHMITNIYDGLTLDEIALAALDTALIWELG